MRGLMIITDEKGKKQGVILSWNKYQKLLKLEKENASLRETLYLLQSKKNRERLLEAVEDVKKGLIEEHELIED
ncbi:MAG TPA: hypothetical protein ENI03_01595 [Thermodesulfobacterium geofontis]|nr:hypothetical protein [Thermodesulfobacterium geofontis]